MLQEDICFGSPSYASTFVCGKNSNGLVEWKNKHGVPLKNLDSGEDSTAAPAPAKTSVKPMPAPVVAPVLDSNIEILHLAEKKVAANGQISGACFIVCRGSGFSADETKSCQAWIRSLRAQLVADGKVKDCVFTEDVYFKSTSAAVACVTGGPANGNIMWLYSDGQSIMDKAVKK